MQTKRFDFTSLALHIPTAIALFSLSYVGDNGEPLSLALLFALGATGIDLLAPALMYTASALFLKNPTFVLLYAGQALLLWLAFFLKTKLLTKDMRKGNFLPYSLFAVSLAIYVFLAPFAPYPLPFDGFLAQPIPQKTIICVFLFLLSAVFTVATRALREKLLRCRWRGEELVFFALTVVIASVGFCRFFGFVPYTGVAFFILLAYTYAVKNASGLLCAFVLALPLTLTQGVSLERFFVYGVAITLFCKTGKLGSAFALLAVFFSYGFFDGLFTLQTEELVARILSALLPCLLFVLLPQAFFHHIENELIFYREKHLSRIAINRNRAKVSGQLFEISALFREIQTTFLSIGDSDSQTQAKEYLKNCVLDGICKKCTGYGACRAKGLHKALQKLVDIGTIKGKASLIDVPAELAAVCGRQSDLLYAVNGKLTEYKKYMLEAENAAAGRRLLADQARGVSEIVKNIALEQSEPLKLYSEKERALEACLSRAGILSTEVLVYGGEDAPTVSLVTFGDADVKKIALCVSELFGVEMSVSEKLNLSKDKFCCILHKKPTFDAAFGVSTATKHGEIASGDTHSVIRIDERKFMVALSDGMGSGEYAKRVSECTISLLESFYRSKMPAPLILSTVNRLLTFSKEETFACVDIAVVDLDAPSADVVKIGSPMGFILSESALQILESDSLPLGILEAIHPSVGTYPLKANDVLLFLSDGVTGAFGSTAELYELLKTVPIANPQQLTDELLRVALARYGGAAKDDMTAVAVRLFESKS